MAVTQRPAAANNRARKHHQHQAKAQEKARAAKKSCPLLRTRLVQPRSPVGGGELCAVVEADDVAREVVIFREFQQQEQDAVKGTLAQEALAMSSRAQGYLPAEINDGEQLVDDDVASEAVIFRRLQQQEQDAVKDTLDQEALAVSSRAQGYLPAESNDGEQLVDDDVASEVVILPGLQQQEQDAVKDTLVQEALAVSSRAQGYLPGESNDGEQLVGLRGMLPSLPIPTGKRTHDMKIQYRH